MDPTRTETARDDPLDARGDRLAAVGPRLAGAAVALAAAAQLTASAVASQPTGRSVAIGDAAGITLPDATAAGPLDPGAIAVGIGGALVLSGVLLAIARLGSRRRRPEPPADLDGAPASDRLGLERGQASEVATGGAQLADDPERLLAEAMGRHHAARRRRSDPSKLPVWVRRLDPESRGADAGIEEPVDIR